MEDFPIGIEGVKKSNSIQLELCRDLYMLNEEIIIKEKLNILNAVRCFNTDDFL